MNTEIRHIENNEVDEINELINQLDIRAQEAIEIINIYFNEYSADWNYIDFLRDEIRVIKKNNKIINKLLNIKEADICEGDDYYLLTNYSTLKRLNNIDFEL